MSRPETGNTTRELAGNWIADSWARAIRAGEAVEVTRSAGGAGVGCSGEAGAADGVPVGCSGEGDEAGDRIDALLDGRPEVGHHPRLGGGAVFCPVPAEHLSIHYGWADCLLSPPVGGVDLWVGEEAEQGVTLVGEVLDEPPVRVAVLGSVDDRIEPSADPFGFDGPFRLGGAPGRRALR